ncbi:glutathione S-transferase [Dichotomopilus funicola]|uniref:Glutathione S-transferase n=1 Tax=Dichotomopilus funicola TaxID=1934379 RepID=A0AAN6UXI1_9PEZI|nr:glutathione S-transferase [Dichotomopilus funicola]
MAPFGKFYTYPDNYRVQRAQAIAALNGLELEIVPDFQMNVTNHSPEFLAKFPLGKVPAFESSDGTLFLTEAQAIARYIADSGPKAEQLLGEDAKTRALIEMWACLADQELAPNATAPFLMTVAKMWEYDEKQYETHLAAVERATKRIATELKDGRKFLVGGKLTLADIMVVGVLQWATKFFVDEAMRKELPGVEEYVRGILEVPELKAAFGGLELCQTRVKA